LTQSKEATGYINRELLQVNEQYQERDFNQQNMLGRKSSKEDLRSDHNMNMPRASGNIENQNMYFANMSIQQNGWQDG
jgi:hypothetical protein